MSKERINLIRSLGSDVVLVSRKGGGFLEIIRRAEALAQATACSFLPRQFSNQDNIDAHYNTTGPEIWWQLRFRALTPDALVAGVRTGGTIMGTGRFLKEKNPSIKLNPIESAESPTLTTGHKVGKHRIQGISDEFVPSILDLNFLYGVLGVEDGDAIVMAKKLANDLGIRMGISSGADFFGCIGGYNFS